MDNGIVITWGAMSRLLAVVFIFLGVWTSIHSVREGHVGVYWRGGALLDRITEPGYHLKIPFLDTFDEVQVTVQSDKVLQIPCGTKGGVTIIFDQIEVVNRLKPFYVYDTVKNYTIHYDRIWIFDKIHHEINQFCSSHTLQEVYIDLFHQVDEKLVEALRESCQFWAPGIEILAIRITKPRIPETVRRNFEEIEERRTRVLVESQDRQVREQRSQTEMREAEIESMKKATVSRIGMETKLLEELARQNMSLIEDQIRLSRERAAADAHHYRVTRQAEALAALHTKEYLYLETVRAFANNSKVFVIPGVPELLGQFKSLMTSIASSDASGPLDNLSAS